MSGYHFHKHTTSLFTQNTSSIRKLISYVFKSITSTERGVSGHHFDKHTASLFIQNALLTRKLTSYVFQSI